MIDIGGVTLLRAAAKNYKYVCVLTDPDDYLEFVDNYSKTTDERRLLYRKQCAGKAFYLTSHYDKLIYQWYFGRSHLKILEKEYVLLHKLKYGCNPHQMAEIYSDHFNKNKVYDILHGSPGYINILDAINSWYLVSEVNQTLNTVCAASFKHTSPAGVSIGTTAIEAYKNARDCDPKSSFGDFIAVSTEVNIELAKYIKNVVSDGIIAPSYSDDAISLLKMKKNGNFIILKGYNKNLFQDIPEIREKNGVVLSQTRNSYKYNMNFSEYKTVTKNKDLPINIRRDMLLACITLKYTQSNSVAICHDGKMIGIGAGQQSRIDCVKLAKRKAEIYFLRQHPKVQSLPCKEKIKRQDRINVQFQYIEDDMSEAEYNHFLTFMNDETQDGDESYKKLLDPISKKEKKEFLKQCNDLVLSSDAFFPFRDSIDQASMIGVKYIIQPGGSVADEGVIEACDIYGMTMVNTGIRLFEH